MEHLRPGDQAQRPDQDLMFYVLHSNPYIHYCSTLSNHTSSHHIASHHTTSQHITSHHITSVN